jgi:hypothetical protein
MTYIASKPIGKVDKRVDHLMLYQASRGFDLGDRVSESGSERRGGLVTCYQGLNRGGSSAQRACYPYMITRLGPIA